MSQTPEERILGLPGYPDERALLGLPAHGPLRSGQIEAALEQRLAQIRSHLLMGTEGATRLVQHLEDAADRLQARIAHAGGGPLHPSAARRAAKWSMLASRRAEEGARVVVPEQVRRSTGLSAEDLTEFDRLALAVLVVSGGWNARSAKRLALIADDFGVSMAHLNKVVLGLTRFLSEGEGLRGAMGNVGSSARDSLLQPRTLARSHRVDRVEGALERALGRIDDALREEVSSGSRASQTRLAIVFTLFALSWIGVLGWLFFGWSGGASNETISVDPASVIVQAPRQTVIEPERGANGEEIMRVSPLAAPVKYPRPPGFTPISPTKAMLDAGGTGALWVSAVEEFARDLRSGGAPDALAFARLRDALLLAADAWPFAGNYRAETVRALSSAVRGIEGSDGLRAFMAAVPGARDEQTGGANSAETPLWIAAWRDAFGAGCLATIALDATQSPTVAAAAREEMRRRQQPLPRGGVRDPFAVGAMFALTRAAAPLADGLALGTQNLEAASRWRQAVDEVAVSSALRNKAAAAAIDASLRAPGAIDAPGPLVDFLASAIQTLDFTGRSDGPDALRDALTAWIADDAIPPSRIWVLTSLLDQDLGIAWFGPDLVLATDANKRARAELADRVARAYPKIERTTAGEAIIVDAAGYTQWTEMSASIAALPASDAADALRRAALLLSHARTARAYELRDPKAARVSAQATVKLLERDEKEWNASPTGEIAGIAATGVVDGAFADELQAAGRSIDQRLSVIRALGARPGASDLGSLDARAIVVEALRGSNPDARAAAATVIADRFASGPIVLRTILDLLSDGSVAIEAREFVSRVVGFGLGGSDWKSQARAAIIARLFRIEDSRAHALDAAVTELVTIANELAVLYDPSTALFSQRPDQALALVADAMRTEARSRFLSTSFPTSIDEIERQRAARRSLAQGAMQRMAAETPAIAQYAAMLLVSRQPVLESRLKTHLAAASRARASAASASMQVVADLEALATMLGEGLAPEASARDAS
jgi:hypothetical protein